MSGEAGGAVLGGVVLLAAAPFILAVAAAAAAGYALIRGGAAAVSYYSEKKKQQEVQKSIYINQCSTELQSVYHQMENISASQLHQFETLSISLSEKLESVGKNLEALSRNQQNTEFLQREIEKSRKILMTSLQETYQIHGRSLLQSAKTKWQECQNTLTKQLNEKEKLEVWAKNTVQHKTMQKALAASVIQDAEASVKALQSLASSSHDRTLSSKCIVMETHLANAKQSFAVQGYQSAFAAAKTVITQCSMLVSEHMQNESEKDMLIAQVLTLLETSYAEMEKNRYLTFDNQKTGKRENKVDLNQFSQGEYLKTMRRIKAEIKNLTEQHPTLYEIKKALTRAEEEIIPQAQKVMDTARKVMQQYYEREAALQAIAEYMKEQNYIVNWMAAAGGDPSQELVVNFTGPDKSESISVTLSSDANVGDIAEMAINIYSYSARGEAISEPERKHFRELISKALNEAGFTGNLACTGKLNQSSENKDFITRSNTLQKKTNRIIASDNNG